MTQVAIHTLKQKFLHHFAWLLGVFIISFSANAAHHGMKKDIVDIAAGNPDFSTLVTAVKAAGLVDTLKGEGPFTVFAPTNEAFAKLPKSTLDALLMPENKDKLVAVLTHHVVPGKVMAADVVKMDSAKTAHGDMVMIKVDGGNVMVDNAMVTATDIKASNGVIHVIDTVIIPK
ncbi:secreted and surface protein [Vibrio ishigakensis]|uniref:Secreted and surface protein n=1 Tax=Vibrio ishigakensis TaxID=1481914 RepID=A0A0B8NJ95_9VIBR|nr:fasciclin domain-containing protein [Vibrio ishigakensis]GAM54750.1 secreted and surface protein [Vibrio ishigakensis]